ncbi:hypothetical protein DPEC_G00018070 [Dallia pectoralis]|uniref:Uncharacterized protein n=1 Tax=Dallia pectoralis TaxID=75939 RepID=A0ACC2HG25_DALPE|nr:hypothetical protein DPEC_G00018070 [Dallia pectoralis]
MKRRTKEKVAYNRGQSRRTGSGPPEIDELTPIEVVVQQTLIAKQLEGVDGIDTAEISVEIEALEEQLEPPGLSRPPVQPALSQHPAGRVNDIDKKGC